MRTSTHADVRFIEVELTYGCHEAVRWGIPRKTSPVVVTGHNGAGKSTLLEGLVRLLFGFNRRVETDRARLIARQPWSGSDARGRLVLADASDELWQVGRSFADSRVELLALERPADVWRGEANPAADNADAREYRERLARLIGFDDREAYEATACVHQGELVRTSLGAHLLRLAAGGHADLNTARETVIKMHRELTVRSITPGGRSANRRRALEQAAATEAALQELLARAREAEALRAPLLASRRDAAETLEAIERDIALLEAAQGPLAERRALDAERQTLQDRLDALERSRQALEDARHRHEAARAAWNVVASGEPYPEDFAARVAALEPLWERSAELSEEGRGVARSHGRARVPAWTVPAALLLLLVAAAGVALALAGQVIPGLAAVVIGLIGAAVPLALRRGRAERRDRLRQDMERVRDELERTEQASRRLLEGVPDAETLSPANARDRQAAFERQRKARERLDRARAELGIAAGASADALREDAARDAADGAGQEESDVAAAQADGAEADAGPDAEAADPARVVALIETLRARAGTTRTRLAARMLERDRALALVVALPAGIAQDGAAVAAALEARRAQARVARDALAEIDVRLLEATTGVDSVVAIQDRLAPVQARRAELEATATAHERAYALLEDAYADFREHDQARLLRRVSERVLALSGGRLGPVSASESLADAVIQADGRSLALVSPPLSYGELHAALFAIRLGATDFLAAAGIRPPLLVDEPFAHLDERHARNLWELLCAIAEERQVIVATQERLVLEHLGVAADLALEAERQPASA
jgi:DNA repair exonuclease SbcCD ATPase subunit